MRNSNLISVHLVLSNLIREAMNINMYVLLAVCVPQSQTVANISAYLIQNECELVLKIYIYTNKEDLRKYLMTSV